MSADEDDDEIRLLEAQLAQVRLATPAAVEMRQRNLIQNRQDIRRREQEIESLRRVRDTFVASLKEIQSHSMQDRQVEEALLLDSKTQTAAEKHILAVELEASVGRIVQQVLEQPWKQNTLIHDFLGNNSYNRCDQRLTVSSLSDISADVSLYEYASDYLTFFEKNITSK